MKIWKWGFNLLILFSNVCIVEDCQHTIYKFLFCLVMSTILYEFNFTIGAELWMFIMLIKKKPRKRVFSQKEWIRTSQHHVMLFHVISFMIVMICKYFFFTELWPFMIWMYLMPAYSPIFISSNRVHDAPRGTPGYHCTLGYHVVWRHTASARNKIM